MREAVGAGLRSRYKPEKEIPHELMVLLMQMKENQRPRKNASSSRRRRYPLRLRSGVHNATRGYSFSIMVQTAIRAHVAIMSHRNATYKPKTLEFVFDGM
jgi:hypothetical protein